MKLTCVLSTTFVFLSGNLDGVDEWLKCFFHIHHHISSHVHVMCDFKVLTGAAPQDDME
jgi:hypothetical protein